MNSTFRVAFEGQPSPGAEPTLGPLKPVANLCTSGSCPTVYTAESGASLVIQGYRVSAEQAGVDLPEGEFLVQIPVELLLEAARNIA